MEDSFARIEAGSRSPLYRCLFVAPEWPQVYECWTAFKERFGERCVYSEVRYVARFRDTGACVIFSGCKNIKEARKLIAAFYTAVEIGPLFETRWEFSEDVETHLLSHVKTNSFMSQRRT